MRFNKYNIVKMLMNVFMFLFVFIMYNREFRPFGIDLRFILIGIAGCLIINFIVCFRGYLDFDFKNIINRIEKDNKELSKIIWVILMFYTIMFLSNIMWFNNGIEVNMEGLKSNIILNGANFLFIITFFLYKHHIKWSKVTNYLYIAHFVLLISMLLVGKGYHLSEIMGGNYPGFYGGAENSNFLGQEFRLAGYAQDPNYASFFMVLTGVTSCFYIKNNWLSIGVLVTSIFGFLLSASRTVTLAVIIAILFVIVLIIIKKINSKFQLYITSLFIIVITGVPYILVKLIQIVQFNFSLDTMSTRLVMWNNAISLFKKSPIIGNGMTSFRSYFELNGGWYVQCHSTIFQLLSENGIIGLILFGTIFALLMKCANNYKIFVCVVFLVFSLTSELIYLAIFPFIIGVLAFVPEEDSVNLLDRMKQLWI